MIRADLILDRALRNCRVGSRLVLAATSVLALTFICGASGHNDSSPQVGKKVTSVVEESSQSQENTPDITAAIDKAVGFLMENQSADGGWHSEHYGSMKQGGAITSLVLYSLSHLPDPVRTRHSDSIQKAAKFLQPGIENKGCVANPDGSLDYPVYSTAMILTAHKKLDLGLSPQQIKRMIGYLIASQCAEPRGFLEGNPNLGGWDILGPGSTQGKTAGANVSVTYYVLEALSLYEDPRVEPVAAAARKWCHRILATNGDGGFYFTSEIRSSLNKAGIHNERTPRAYGSSTCDGLSILLLTGSDPKSKLVGATVDWLTDHAGTDSVPGFLEADRSHGWAFGLRYYYLNGLSRVVNLFEPPLASKQKLAIAQLLTDIQEQSGGWKSEFKNMREDDPLIATPLALIALNNIQN